MTEEVDTANAEGDVLGRETYRHLRLMLVTLPLLMLLTMAFLYFGSGSVEPSISAYYLGPIRDVFVGALIATAVCLIVYRGFPPFEDYALNVAGFYGFFVALVPTQLEQSLSDLSTEEYERALLGVRVSLAAVVVVAIVFVLLERKVGHWTASTLLKRPATGAAFVIFNALGLAFLGLVVVNGYFDDSFKGVHMCAAILLFAGLALAVASHGWPSKFDGEGEGGSGYRVIFGGMVLGGLAVTGVFVMMGSDHTVLVLEAWEIAWFMGFWIMELKRTWPGPTAGE